MNSSLPLLKKINPGKSDRNDFELDPNKVALIVIDIQEELSYPSELTQELLSNVKSLLQVMRENRENIMNNGATGSEIIFTYLEAQTDNSRDVSTDYKLSGSLSNLPSPSKPTVFVNGIEPIKGVDILMPKTSCSVFISTNIDFVLRNLSIEQVILCGQLTNQCVESAARDAADLGYFVTVVSNACFAKSPVEHEKGIFGMKGFARIIPTDQVLQELSAPQKSESFQKDEVTKLVSDEEHSKFTLLPLSQNSAEEGALNALLNALNYAKVRNIRFGFVDIGGAIRCKVVPLSRVKENNINSLVNIAKVVSAGLPSYGDAIIADSGLDASGNLTLHADLSTLRILPYASSSAMVLCYQYEQQKLSNFCSRSLLKQVIETVEKMDEIQFCVGAEIEFSLYKGEKVEQVDQTCFAHTKTLNEQENVINEIEDMLIQQGIKVELLHAESGGGQVEIVLQYLANPLVMADNIIYTKETISSCAKKHNLKALFLPKVSPLQAGNGLHLHFSIIDKKTKMNLFADYSCKMGISSKGKSFMEGILSNLSSLLSFTLPSQNSFRRVGPGCWTGHTATWEIEDKEQPLRVCLNDEGYATHFEYKLNDACSNIYLSLIAILLCGMDGVRKKLTLRPTSHETIHDRLLPKTLQDSLTNLEQNSFLINQFSSELITAYIAVKRNELEFFKNMSIEDEVEFAYNRT